MISEQLSENNKDAGSYTFNKIVIIFIIMTLIMIIMVCIKLKFDNYMQSIRDRARDTKVYQKQENGLRPIQEQAIAIGIKVDKNISTFEGEIKTTARLEQNESTEMEDPEENLIPIVSF